MAGAGFKVVKHYYPDTENGKKSYKECKLLLKAHACKDKDSCIKGIQKIEVEVADDPVTDAELTKHFLRRPTGEKKRLRLRLSRSLTSHEHASGYMRRPCKGHEMGCL